ncbi:hypothetical protein [Mucilaginibacter lacusdianchii]|uniref:hypothetical protein n=1 Tax=Mucilaginibacter lacusdianchii TaxID=2684211 RepID=UPI00131BB5B6|nr:hypothetical protein [Mucilaginibacter sp. JXJ CY 39]
MNITPAQQDSIREVLWHNTKYRETFEEIYDHIITSIEHEPEGTREPHEVAQDIISNEFGGWEKLKELEKLRQTEVSSHIRAKQWQYFKEYFKAPLIVFTLLSAAVVYYMASHVTRKPLFIIIYIMAMAPVGLWVKVAPFNPFSKKHKPSVKQGIAQSLCTIGMSIFNCLVFLPSVMMNDDQYKFFNQMHISVLTVIAVLYIVLGLSIVKVFKEDLKILYTA